MKSGKFDFKKGFKNSQSHKFPGIRKMCLHYSVNTFFFQPLSNEVKETKAMQLEQSLNMPL